MEPVALAETYSRAERIRFAGIGIVLGAVAIGTSKLWIFPWLVSYSSVAPCRSILGINGATVIWYSFFVGLPLLAAFVAGLGFGRHGMHILRKKQFPLPGAKVFRATRIKRGTAAIRIGYLHVFAFVPFLALAVLGYSQTATLPRHKASPTACSANDSLKPKPHRGSISTPAAR